VGGSRKGGGKKKCGIEGEGIKRLRQLALRPAKIMQALRESIHSRQIRPALNTAILTFPPRRHAAQTTQINTLLSPKPPPLPSPLQSTKKKKHKSQQGEGGNNHPHPPDPPHRTHMPETPRSARNRSSPPMVP